MPKVSGGVQQNGEGQWSSRFWGVCVCVFIRSSALNSVVLRHREGTSGRSLAMGAWEESMAGGMWRHGTARALPRRLCGWRKKSPGLCCFNGGAEERHPAWSLKRAGGAVVKPGGSGVREAREEGERAARLPRCPVGQASHPPNTKQIIESRNTQVIR